MVDLRTGNTDLKTLVTRYLNGELYFKKYGSHLDEITSKHYIKEMEKIEDALRDQGVTEEQFDKLLYYAKYYYGMKVYKMTEQLIYYISQMVFSGQLEK